MWKPKLEFILKKYKSVEEFIPSIILNMYNFTCVRIHCNPKFVCSALIDRETLNLVRHLKYFVSQKTHYYGILLSWRRSIFQISAKIFPENVILIFFLFCFLFCVCFCIWFWFLLIMKRSDYNNIHRRFQVHSTTIFSVIKSKNKYSQVATTNYHQSLVAIL